MGAAILLTCSAAARAAEAPYPFEGTWVRAERACSPNATRVRTYTSRDVTSPRGHCAIRRVAAGGGAFELLEECRRDGRSGSVTETIKLSGPDTMTVRRQLSRLKITRPLRYQRCSAAAPKTGLKPKP